MGSIGSGTRPAVTTSGCSSTVAIHIQQLQSGCLQALGEDLHEPSVNLIAEVVVLIALGAKALASKCQRYGANSHDHPNTSPSPTVCTVVRPLCGITNCTDTKPSRMR